MKIPIFVLMLGLSDGVLGNESSATEPSTPIPSAPPPETEGFLKYKPNSAQNQDTYQFLKERDQPNATPQQQQRMFIGGQNRAQQMVQMLQNQELTNAFSKIMGSGKRTLDENPELKTPLGIVAGAAAFWYGRTIKLIQGDYNVTTRVEGRTGTGEFSMNSPLLNGKLRFDAREGMGIGIDRSIQSIQTEASIQYNPKNQGITTEVRKKLAPNLDLSFGASRNDQNTKIEYRLNF